MPLPALRLSAIPFLAMSLCGSAPDANLIKELQIYFIPWNIETNHDLKASDVRRTASTRWQILTTNSIEEALSALPISSLVSGNASSPDLRLVIDIHFKNGVQSSYFSDGRYLYSSDLKCRTKINQLQVNKRLLDRLEHLQ